MLLLLFLSPPYMYINTFSKVNEVSFKTMGGHGNFAFNLIVKVSVELGYVFLSLRLPMSSALLSVLLVCNRRILRHPGKFSNMLFIFVLIGPHDRHLSDGNQTACPTPEK
jgi:hypothetical protein